jgi:hypothetical protein
MQQGPKFKCYRVSFDIQIAKYLDPKLDNGAGFKNVYEYFVPDIIKLLEDKTDEGLVGLCKNKCKIDWLTIEDQYPEEDEEELCNQDDDSFPSGGKERFKLTMEINFKVDVWAENEDAAKKEVSDKVEELADDCGDGCDLMTYADDFSCSTSQSRVTCLAN